MIHAFFLAWLGVVAAQASPGPNMFAVAETALGRGRGRALLVVSGIASGTLVWALLTALGLGALFAAVPALLVLLKFVGGLYLLYIGIRGLIGAARGLDPRLLARAAPLSAFAAWRRGFLVVMTNPKAALMWIAIATFLFGSGLGNGHVPAFGPVVAVSALVIYGGYGLLFSTPLATRTYNRFWRWIGAAFGAAFSGLGLTLLTSGLRDLRP